MERRGNPLSKDSIVIWSIAVRIIPILVFGVISSLIGFRGARSIQDIYRPVVGVIYLASILAVLVLDTQPGWNILFFILFCLTSGFVTGFSGLEVTCPYYWLILIVIFIVAIIIGQRIKNTSDLPLRSLFWGSIFYGLGWTILLYCSLSGWVHDVWIILGTFLFSLILVVFASNYTVSLSQNQVISLAINIFLLLFNLYLLITILGIST